MFDLDWMKRVFLGEPPRSARFDLQVQESVSVSVDRAGVSLASRLIPSLWLASPPADISLRPIESRGVHVRAREPVPADYLARQHPEARERVRKVFRYRDRLQSVLDTDWPNLTREEVYVRALEGYRWLALLENAMAQDPARFAPALDDAGQILDRFVQHAQPR
jgi:hypothetical protein